MDYWLCRTQRIYFQFKQKQSGHWKHLLETYFNYKNSTQIVHAVICYSLRLKSHNNFIFFNWINKLYHINNVSLQWLQRQDPRMCYSNGKQTRLGTTPRPQQTATTHHTFQNHQQPGWHPGGITYCQDKWPSNKGFPTTIPAFRQNHDFQTILLP